MNSFFKHLRNFLTVAVKRDWERKAVALVLALIVYIFVSRELTSSYNSLTVSGIPVGIRLPETPVKYDFLGGESPSVKLQILVHRSRTGVTAADFKCREIVVTPDMIRGNRLDLPIAPSDFSTPRGCRISAVEPAVLTLSVDKYASKKLPVKVIFDGKLPKNYDARAVQDQDKLAVTVTALESLLKKLTDVKTEPINLDNITQSFDYYAAIKPPLASDVKFQFAPPKVMVRVDVYRRILSRTFRRQDVILLTGKRDKPLKAELVKDSTADVEVSGEKIPLSRLKSNQIKVFADVSMFDRPGVYQVDLSCWLTENDFTVDSITPKTVQVKVFQ